MATSFNEAIRKIIEDLSVDMYGGKPIPPHVLSLCKLLRKLDMKASLGDDIEIMGIPMVRVGNFAKQTK